MISAMGDAEGKPKGGFVLLDEDFKVWALSQQGIALRIQVESEHG